MKDAVITGTYSDFKIIKTRKVAQMVVEFPIEQGDQFISKFGLPKPHEEKWVAVAWVRSEAVETTGRASKAIQQAGILCKDVSFGVWLNETKGMGLNPKQETEIQDAVRAILGVSSRADMRTNEQALQTWEKMYSEYQNC
ncbi:MAG TPA: hypothetical protein DF712_07885 [Balneola sp.]|nr:hypothetical protein [Balneola sp.]|tara:strand:- start:11340 stop:11759 length:420 start_codon:yes stop_codon:yes gene_type:complete